jgi:excisionase family DNA binding protein
MSAAPPSLPMVLLTPEQLREVVSDAVRSALPARAEPAEAEVMTRLQVAKFLQVNSHQIPVLIRKHGLPSHHVGSQWRFRRSEVLAWMAATGKGAR